MDWTTIITALMTTVLGGGVGVLATLKSAKKKAAAEAQSTYDQVYAARLDQLREEVDFERQRNVDLDKQHKGEIDYERARNKELIQRNDDKERRFQDQTNRLREVQDRELKANEKILELTKTIADRDLELAHKRCEILDCPWRKPPTASTPPLPEMDKDDWHTSKTPKKKTTKTKKV